MSGYIQHGLIPRGEPMIKIFSDNWESSVVSPETAIEKIRPGMLIFLGTAMAEPRTMVRHLMTSAAKNLEDLELIQLISFGDAVTLQTIQSQNFRLKTFFSGWVANEAIEEGRVDLIPSRHAKIPQLIESRQIPVDVAIVQITPPNAAGFCSLGIAVDVAREAMEQASIRIGEINTQIPRTFGDTFVQITDFDFLIRSTDPPIYFERSIAEDRWAQVAQHVASLIEDKSCLAFSIGPFYDALARCLTNKHHLGIHSPVFTDPLMDLMICGAVTNRYKETHRGKSLTSYALGTADLLKWLDNNPLVEFQRIDKVFNPLIIGRNPRFVTLIAARKVDLYGRIGLNMGKSNLASGPAEVMDFINGAELSEGGRAIFALTSRDQSGEPNMLASIADMPNQFGAFESVSAVVTEYGVAYLEGRTVRERAQALIDIAHPDDRAGLVEAARNRKIVYPNQIFIAESARLYPSEITAVHVFRGNNKVRFRAIRPSDEEDMRHLFYRFSDEAVYYRYFHSVRSMPHAKMQEYVNVDWNQIISIVGLVGEEKNGRVIAEARYIKIPGSAYAEIVFVVDEDYQRLGIASFLYGMLIRLARERGVKGFVADVLFSNTGMMHVFQKGDLPVKAHLEGGVFNLAIPFSPE
jgi:acyl-CoA hydrolase/GNAT superfamily N-acetyltransferase